MVFVILINWGITEITGDCVPPWLIVEQCFIGWDTHKHVEVLGFVEDSKS